METLLLILGNQFCTFVFCFCFSFVFVSIFFLVLFFSLSKSEEPMQINREIKHETLLSYERQPEVISKPKVMSHVTDVKTEVLPSVLKL